MNSQSRRRYAVLGALLVGGLLLVGIGRRSLDHSVELAFATIDCREPPNGECAAQLERADQLRLVGHVSLWSGAALTLIACALELARFVRDGRNPRRLE